MRPAFLADPKARRHVLQLADTLLELSRFFLPPEDELLKSRFWTVREVACSLVMDGARHGEDSYAAVEVGYKQLKYLQGENHIEPSRDDARQFASLLSGALYRLISGCTSNTDTYAHYLDYADDFVLAALTRKHKAGDRSVLPWLEGSSELCPQDVRLGIKSAMQAAAMIPALKAKPEPTPPPVFTLPSPQDLKAMSRVDLNTLLGQEWAKYRIRKLGLEHNPALPVRDLRGLAECLRGDL